MLPVKTAARKMIWQEDNISDGEHWYHHLACKRLPEAQGIRYYCIEEEPDGAVRTKRQTECFDDHYFPCQEEDCDMQHIWNWLKNVLTVSTIIWLLTGYVHNVSDWGSLAEPNKI